MASSRKRRKHKKKRVNPAIFIVALLLLLTAAGVVAGVQLRARRQAREAAEIAAAEAEQARLQKEAEEAKRAAEEAAAEAERLAEEARKKQEEMDEAARLLEEQSKAGKIENAKIILGAGAVGATEVNAYSKKRYEEKIITAEDTPEKITKIICIDPGHQAQQITEMEPNAPGSEVMKQGSTSGAYGEASGKNEYEIVLEVGLRLKEELLARGYEVVMTRENHEASISNVQRAQMATAANADLFVRLHCNGVDDPNVQGVLCYMPSEHNPYLTPEVIAGSRKLSALLRDHQCQLTGQMPRDNLEGDDMTGINWATMPVSIIEMGFMSNAEEDMMMASAEGQSQIAIGLANGIDAYFAS